MPHFAVGCTTHARELAASKARSPHPPIPRQADEAPSRVAAMIIPKLSSSALHMRQAWGAALASAVSTEFAPHSSQTLGRFAARHAPLYAPQELQTTPMKRLTISTSGSSCRQSPCPLARWAFHHCARPRTRGRCSRVAAAPAR